MDDLLLGVEGAGQATQAVIAGADGQVLGRGLGPPSNHHRVGFENARRNLVAAIEAALSAARRSLKEPASSWTRTGIEAEIGRAHV
jgi:N-acetylglucosamine kinase-like BadF-type ATPase